MSKELAAVALCVVAQAAAAQCAVPQATHAQPATAATAPTPTTQKQPAEQRTGLIKTAAAGTRDDAPPVVRESARNREGQDHPRRGGTAMLLAALALMSGIALRRYGADKT